MYDTSCFRMYRMYVGVVQKMFENLPASSRFVPKGPLLKKTAKNLVYVLYGMVVRLPYHSHQIFQGLSPCTGTGTNNNGNSA